MIIRYAFLALMVVSLGFWADFNYRKARSATARAESAEAQVQGYKEAAKIHAKYLIDVRAANVAWDELTNEVLNMDGKDAPLSDYLRDAAGRVWP